MATNGHILVVEDECVNAAMIEHQLRRLGYSIAGIASSGEEAVEQAASARPDLVLMDIGLEGTMDGVEAASIIRRRFEIPVIYLTTNSDKETIERARSTEAYGYLHKPLYPQELHSTVQIALYKARTEARLREERKWLVTTLRCISDGVIATDALGTVKLVNPAAERLIGWPQQDAVSRDLGEVYRALEPETRAPAACTITRMIGGTSEIVHSHKLLVARGGTEFEVEERAAAITDESGDMIGVVLVFHQPSAAG